MLLLQFAVFILAGLLLFAAIGIAWVIYQDARKRGVSDFYGTIWAIGSFLLAPVTIPLYLVLVVRHRNRDSPLKSRELWLIWLFCSLFAPLTVSALFLPPDPFTQMPIQVILTLAFAAFFYILIFSKLPNRVSGSLG